MFIGFLINFFVFVFGLCIGSFLNCIIYRLEKEESFVKGRSYCPHCKHTLAWHDLIPVFSFIFLKGKCRYCRKKISWQYPVVELATGFLFLLIFLILNYQFSTFNEYSVSQLLILLFYFYISSALIVIFVYDLKHYLIPDKVLLTAIIISFVYRLLGNWPIRDLIPYFIAVFLGAGFFLLIFLVSKGKWMGLGDVKLTVLLGLILGFPKILVGLFLAFFLGAIIGVALMLLKKKGLKSEVPFGPFLIAGTFIVILWGQQLISWYLNLII